MRSRASSPHLAHKLTLSAEPITFSNGDTPLLHSTPDSDLPADPVTLSNEFLRRTNDLLVALLSPSQKLEFLSLLTTSPETTPFLVDGAKEELEAIKARLLENPSIDAVVESARAARGEGTVAGEGGVKYDSMSGDTAKRGGRKAPPAELVRPDVANLSQIRSPPVRSGSRSPTKFGSPVKSVFGAMGTRSKSGSSAVKEEKEN